MEEQQTTPPACNLFGDLLPNLAEENKGELAWQKEWKGMPEFIQNDQEPKFSVRVNFETEDDLYAFAKLVDQKITFRTQSIWYPKVDAVKVINKMWVNES